MTRRRPSAADLDNQAFRLRAVAAGVYGTTGPQGPPGVVDADTLARAVRAECDRRDEDARKRAEAASAEAEKHNAAEAEARKVAKARADAEAAAEAKRERMAYIRSAGDEFVRLVDAGEAKRATDILLSTAYKVLPYAEYSEIHRHWRDSDASAAAAVRRVFGEGVG